MGKYINGLNHSANPPKEIAIGAEEELNEDDKAPTILTSEGLKAVEDMWKKHWNTQNTSGFVEKMGENGIKMTIFFNKM